VRSMNDCKEIGKCEMHSGILGINRLIYY